MTDDAASAAQRPGIILNVTDDDPQRSLVSTILRSAGYRVIEAATGLEAVDLARRDRPDVVVLDIRLPDINGMEVCRRLKQDALSATPFVLHTSTTLASTGLRVAGLDVGGDAFLAQPFTAEELVATVRALVRRKRVDEEQRRRAEEFAEADRRKDDFLAMLGHELRNPLNALTMSQAIIEQYPAQSPVEQHARAVARRQTAQLTRLVNDLLEVSRVTRGKITLSKSLVDLGDVVRETAGVIRSTTTDARSQTLALSVPDFPVPVEGDRVRLGQILANLLENASKYSPDHTQIDVGLAVEPRDGRSVAVVTVVDRGQGIAGEQLGHVFSLFYQARPSEARIGTGLGIGLTLVRALAELHGGSVAVRSAGLGRGSAFEVRLPMRPDLVAARSHDARESESERRRLARAGRTVLIVEDNADARDLLETLCRTWGFEVAIASNGLLGVEKALMLRPHLSLVDIGLPGIDGYEVARRLRANPATQQLTLVALTGYGLPAQREKALAAGFDAYLVKPVDPELLARLIDEPLGTIARLKDRRRSLQPTDVERRAPPPL